MENDITLEQGETEKKQIKEIIKKSLIQKSKQESKYQIINFNKDTINNILNNKGKSKITIYFKIDNIDIKYNYKNKSTNFYFYECRKRPKCKGKGRFNVKCQFFR